MDNYEFRPITPDNLTDVVRLVESIVKKRLSRATYQRKYQTPWAANARYGWLAYDAATGQPAAVVAAQALRLVLPDGTDAPVVHIVETFTAPAHQGRGLMTRLVRQVVEEHQSGGTQLFFGLTNQNNVYGFVNKLGFTNNGTMQYFQVKTGAFPLEALCRRVGLPGLFRWWARQVLRPFVAPAGHFLPNSVQADGYVGLLHNRDFFEFKQFTFNYLCRFEGIDSWLKFNTGLLVGDVQLPATCPDAQFDAWLATLVRLARRLGLRQVVFQTFGESQLSRHLARHYPANASWSMCCLGTEPGLQPVVEQMRFGYGDFDSF
jgi:GNAT superfamily N-acetyltransferase